MFEVITQLKERKEKLASSFKRQKNEYRSKINQIDRAINSFEKGFKELQGEELRPPTTADIVETILRESRKPLHLKKIVAELNRRRNITSPYQSVSRLLQTYSKMGKRFKRVSPATFTLVQTK